MSKLAPLIVVFFSVFAFAQDSCKTCYADFVSPVGFYGSTLCIPAQRCGNGPPPIAAFCSLRILAFC
jgi:hypothetical protein